MSQAQKIQKYVIKSTPYGQLPDVLKDLHRISPIDLTSPILLTAIEDYNEEHLAIVSGQNKQVVLMSSNKRGDSQYIDQIEGIVYTVDHVKQQIIREEHEEVQLMEEVKQLLKHLKSDFQAYVSQYFRTPNGVQVFAEISEEGLGIHIGFTSKNISIGKFYTGEWISKWKITKDSIQGLVNIRAHFFEGGNVQFNNKRQCQEHFQFTHDMNENAKMIVKVIRSFEISVQNSLNNIYEEMPQKFFKKLRRLAPYTKTKMSWNLNSIKMNHNILEGKKK